MTPPPDPASRDRGSSPARPSRLLRPMIGRRPDEEHRTSTPLELLFDLCFVVAVSQAASQLRHGLAGHALHDSIQGYLMVFFAIWWAWMNFTWFASAYDTDDVLYRLLTFVQITGALILAAGVPDAFTGNFTTITIGYVVMRIALVAQWLRAARCDPVGRPNAMRYAIGIVLVQALWVLRLFLPGSLDTASFFLIAAADIAVPLWAERAGTRMTAWHPDHIAERYGLFTLIVLGEAVAAATVAIQQATSERELDAAIVAVAAGGLALVFSIWWWYFEHPSEDALRSSPSTAFTWGYGHYFVFASIAALGAGIELAAEATGPHGHALDTVAGLTVAIAAATFFVVTVLLQSRLHLARRLPIAFVVGAGAAIVVVGALARSLSVGVAVVVIGAIAVALVVADSLMVVGSSGGEQ